MDLLREQIKKTRSLLNALSRRLERHGTASELATDTLVHGLAGVRQKLARLVGINLVREYEWAPVPDAGPETPPDPTA